MFHYWFGSLFRDPVLHGQGWNVSGILLRGGRASLGHLWGSLSKQLEEMDLQCTYANGQLIEQTLARNRSAQIMQVKLCMVVYIWEKLWEEPSNFVGNLSTYCI